MRKFGGKLEEPIDIPVTPARKVIGIIGCIAAVFEPVVMVMCSRLDAEHREVLIPICLCVLILLAFAILHCFLPGAMWTLEHSLDTLHYKEMPLPSVFGLAVRTISCALLVILSIGMTVVQLMFALGVF